MVNVQVEWTHRPGADTKSRDDRCIQMQRRCSRQDALRRKEETLRRDRLLSSSARGPAAKVLRAPRAAVAEES